MGVAQARLLRAYPERGMLVDAVARDTSLDKLLELKLLGYTTVTWKSYPFSKDPRTLALDGQSWTIDEFVSGLSFGAPIFERGHVQDKSTLIVSGPGLSDVEIRAWDF